VCGSVFQGRKRDFLPTQRVVRSAPVATSTSLKRKRDKDDDADLYGESETEKKSRGNKEVSYEQNNVEYAMQVDETITSTEELEWLIFLVSQEGDLQVYHPSPVLTSDPFINKYGSHLSM
jgi:hypothetical protein